MNISNPSIDFEVGSFLCQAVSGWAAPPADAQVDYVRIGKMVMLIGKNNQFAVSNTTDCQFTGLPASIRPTTVRKCFAIGLVDNGNFNIVGGLQLNNTASIILLAFSDPVVATPIQYNSNGFTAAGNKGLGSGWTASYPIN